MPTINGTGAKTVWQALKSGAKKTKSVFRKPSSGLKSLPKDRFTPVSKNVAAQAAKISPGSSYEDITQAVKNLSETPKPAYNPYLSQPNLRTGAYRQSKLQQEHRLQNLGLVNAGKKPVTFEQFKAQKAQAEKASEQAYMNAHAASYSQPVDDIAYQASGYRSLLG